MTNTTGIIPFGPHGPEDSGLQEWDPIDPSEIFEGTPVQRGHIYDQDPAFGYLTGVWDCTAFTGKRGPYPDDELMILLEGTLILVLADGSEVTVTEGDAFVIPKGLELQWKQPGYLRKFFMILSEPVDKSACNPALGQVTVVDPDGALLAPGAIETDNVSFMNSTGRMSVSVTTLAARSEPERPAPVNDLIHVISGSLTLTSMGPDQTFGPGETVYVRSGTRVARSVTDGTRLLMTRFDPN